MASCFKRSANRSKLQQWSALDWYVEDGDLSIDNNPAERAMRPIAVVRKIESS